MNEGASPVVFHSPQCSFLLVGYERHDGQRTVQWHAVAKLRGRLIASTGPNVPHGENGCSLGVQEQGGPDMVVGDQVVHAYFFAPTDDKFSEIGL